MLAYEGMTALDLVGPQYVLSSILGLTVYLAARSLDPIRTDTGIVLLPDTLFADCPDEPTILFVPGGTEGTLAAITDDETLAFVKRLGARAEYVTSVCTGSLLHEPLRTDWP